MEVNNESSFSVLDGEITEMEFENGTRIITWGDCRKTMVAVNIGLILIQWSEGG